MKKTLLWIFSILILIGGIAAATKQLIGPSAPTTNNAVVRWLGTSAFQTTNSQIIIDDSGNMSGINSQIMIEADISTAYLTNGFIFLQKTSFPIASDFGMVAPGTTNIMIKNVNGGLFKCSCDSSGNVYNQEIGTH